MAGSVFFHPPTPPPHPTYTPSLTRLLSPADFDVDDGEDDDDVDPDDNTRLNGGSYKKKR